MSGVNGVRGEKAQRSMSREDSSSATISLDQTPGILRDPPVQQPRKWNTDIPNILPHERVFPIQIGSELFRLSGASISSDGMYFLVWDPEGWDSEG